VDVECETSREREGETKQERRSNHQSPVFSRHVPGHASPYEIIRPYFIIIQGSQPNQTWINNLSSQSGGYTAACQSLCRYRSPTARCVSLFLHRTAFEEQSGASSCAQYFTLCVKDREAPHVCLWAATAPTHPIQLWGYLSSPLLFSPPQNDVCTDAREELLNRGLQLWIPACVWTDLVDNCLTDRSVRFQHRPVWMYKWKHFTRIFTFLSYSFWQGLWPVLKVFDFISMQSPSWTIRYPQTEH